jgi:hypothetical protein
MKNQIDLRHQPAPPALSTATEPEAEWPLASLPAQRMFSFHYSCTEVFSQDGNMHVRMKQTHYQDGRLRSEECEGRLDSQAAERMIAQAQEQFLAQAFGVARLLLAPFLSRPGRRD